MYSQQSTIVDGIKDCLNYLHTCAIRYVEIIQEQRYRIARHKLAYVELSNLYEYFWMSKGHKRTYNDIGDCYEHSLRDIV